MCPFKFLFSYSFDVQVLRDDEGISGALNSPDDDASQVRPDVWLHLQQAYQGDATGEATSNIEECLRPKFITEGPLR